MLVPDSERDNIITDSSVGFIRPRTYSHDNNEDNNQI